MQIGGFIASRPRAILDLYYRHIRATLLRDPNGGPNTILLEFTFEFTKSFLSIKDVYVFISSQMLLWHCLLSATQQHIPDPRNRV